MIKNSTKFTDEEKQLIEINGYGHVGDGNLHVNVTLPGRDNQDLQNRLIKEIEPFYFNYVKDANGSISAEHGIGFFKTDVLEYSKSKQMIAYMERIKNVFDLSIIG